MKPNSRILIIGRKKYINEQLKSGLKKKKFKNIFIIDDAIYNISNLNVLEKFFKKFKPEFIFLLGGKSGGIKANIEMPATLMLDNIAINYNTFFLSKKFKIKKILYLASSCIYPKKAKNPLHIKSIMTDQLEPSNQSYAMSKLVGLELCKCFRQEYNLNAVSVIPSTIFGPGDNFDNDNAHVISSLIRKLHNAKINNQKFVTLWGSGKPIRDFIYIDDLIDSLIHIMLVYNEDEPINVSSGEATSIKNLANDIKKIVNFNQKILFDKVNPDGMPIKILNIKNLKKIGWKPKITTLKGLKSTYKWYLKNKP